MGIWCLSPDEPPHLGPRGTCDGSRPELAVVLNLTRGAASSGQASGKLKENIHAVVWQPNEHRTVDDTIPSTKPSYLGATEQASMNNIILN